MPTDVRRLSASAAMKALAHPLRMQILELLAAHGAMTATELAARTADSPSNCSWHLRKLAEHGFVAEAPGARGRNRPWQAVGTGLTWDEPHEEHGEDPEASAAGDALVDLVIERELARLRAARARRDREAPAWRDAIGLNRSQLWLTAEEAREVSDRMVELFASKADRRADPSRRPPGARLVSLVGWVVASEPGPDPGDEQSDADR